MLTMSLRLTDDINPLRTVSDLEPMLQLVGWLVFNGTFSTKRLYRAM